MIDVPSQWLPWRENILRGADEFYIVTELTVSGMRQARRLAEMLASMHGLDTTATVIVNKVPWMGGGVSRRHARDALGGLLAGFVSECGPLVHDAQNRGVMLSQVKRNNRVHSELAAILSHSAKTREKSRPAGLI